MKPNRKPNRRTINRIALQTAVHLRELVAEFCRTRGGTMIRPRSVSTDFGVFGASWDIPTGVGLWVVHEPSDPSTGLVSINTRFENPDALQTAIARGDFGPRFALDFNRYSGKWNHNAAVLASNDPKAFAESFILDLEHRSKFLFRLCPVCGDTIAITGRTTDGRAIGSCGDAFELDATSDPTSCDQRVAPSFLADGEGATTTSAPGNKVRRKRRAATAGVAGDDQDGVLPKDVPQVGGEALRLGGERRASTAIVLRSEDVERETGLALPEEDARGRRDGVAGEVAVSRRRNGRRGLLRVDGPAKRRARQGTALAEADHDADRARGDGTPEGPSGATAEGHVLSVIQERRVLKKWAAPDYVLLWFDRGDTSRVRMTIEHVDPLRAKFLVRGGWRETKPGCYTRVIPCTALASTLAVVGRVIVMNPGSPTV